MGMLMKPKKCHSFSLVSRKPSVVPFTLMDHSNPNNPSEIVLKSLQDDPHKFLGSHLTFKNSAADHFEFLYDKFETKMKNLDSASVRGEYKVATYDRYLLPSLRYHFGVHNIHQTHLDKLDMLAKKYLKSWLKIPSRGVTELTFFHPHLLGLVPPSQLYFTAHGSNFVNNRMKGDKVVNAAMDSAINRESQWSHKSSTIVKCDNLFKQISETQLIPDIDNCVNVACSTAANLPKIKEAMTKSITNEYKDYWNELVKDLTMQGDFVQLLNQEEADISWKSIIYGVPRGVMSFACRAATNSLATNDNLVRWSDPTPTVNSVGTRPLCVM